jgi:hypothetical protein
MLCITHVWPPLYAKKISASINDGQRWPRWGTAWPHTGPHSTLLAGHRRTHAVTEAVRTHLKGPLARTRVWVPYSDGVVVPPCHQQSRLHRTQAPPEGPAPRVSSVTKGHHLSRSSLMSCVLVCSFSQLCQETNQQCVGPPRLGASASGDSRGAKQPSDQELRSCHVPTTTTTTTAGSGTSNACRVGCLFCTACSDSQFSLTRCSLTSLGSESTRFKARSKDGQHDPCPRSSNRRVDNVGSTAKLCDAPQRSKP